MKPTRLRTRAAARRYVAYAVATTLRNDLDSGAWWLHRSVGDEGNLAGVTSERLAHEAALELIEQLRHFSKTYREKP